LTFDSKIRLRSDAELETQNEGLVILKNLLDKIKITSFLSSGTLLGAVREKDFIRWDWDVQMYLLMEEAYPNRNKISETLLNHDFIIHKFIDSKDTLKWDLRRNGAVFELTAWFVEGKWRYRRKKSMRVPAYLFEGVYNIDFKNVNYRTFNPPEEYLEFCYGDWKIPKRTSDKRIYSNSNHLRKYSSSIEFFRFIKKLIKKIF
jgi:phosphorylcholine metabolism protein LicD